MSELSTQPYKGTNDFYPVEMNVQRYIFDTWSQVAKEFGYEEYDTPLIEEVELYKKKSGDEIANTQLYSFTDKGGREIALRPEMTPSLARMIAAKKKEMTFPLRLFNIGKYYRYEKPQRGRTREFVQLNIDIFGVSSMTAEIEIIQYILAVMDKFNAPKDTYELRINNRYLLDFLFEKILDLKDDQKQIVGRAIDNYPKMEEKEFYEYLADIGLNRKQTEDIKEYLTWTLKDLENIKEECKGAQQLLELFKKAEMLEIRNIKFEPSIMRGFLYYTGTVIEMFDIGSKENPRAMFGGGRYDDLLEIFGEDKLSAFGMGWGNITMRDYLETYNLIPNEITQTKVFIPLLEESLYEDINRIASLLRTSGINTEIQLEPTKLKKQFKYADKKGFPYVLILGEEELEKNVVQLKDMKSGESDEMKIEDVVQKLQ
jgi:histidyl-tRNA synthetase